MSARSDGVNDANERALWLWHQMTPEEHIIDHLRHTMMSVRDLPEYAADDGLAWPVDVILGCREAFYMHARTVAEFFVRFPKGDWTARDFLPNWEPPEVLADRLGRVWFVATKHIAHMSRERVPDVENFTQEDVSLSGLTEIAADCHRVLAAFLADYRRETSALHVEALTSMLRGRNVEAWVQDWIDLEPWQPSGA